MMRDVLLAVRADEATHRQYVNQFFTVRFFLKILSFRVNHKLADVGPDSPNPFLIEAMESRDPPNLQEQREIDTAEKK
jgi:hypothetical protein